jgi:hypothetical protein
MDELIKLLRVCEERDTCGGCPYLGTGECDNKAEKAADAVEELLQKMQQLPRWIPVTERLPEKNGPYLCCWKASADEKMHIARIMVWRADTGWMNAWDEPMSKYVTHWMPLPESPKEGET